MGGSGWTPGCFFSKKESLCTASLRQLKRDTELRLRREHEEQHRRRLVEQLAEADPEDKQLHRRRVKVVHLQKRLRKERLQEEADKLLGGGLDTTVYEHVLVCV